MLHVAVATRAFRRYSTYTAPTLAGIFTNSVFGVIYSFAYLALWDENPTAGGYDATDAVTHPGARDRGRHPRPLLGDRAAFLTARI